MKSSFANEPARPPGAASNQLCADRIRLREMEASRSRSGSSGDVMSYIFLLATLIAAFVKGSEFWAGVFLLAAVVYGCKEDIVAELRKGKRK